MKHIIYICILLVGASNLNGQFLKKLGESVKDAAENATIRKTERETEKKTDKTLDKVFNPNLNKNKKDKKEETSTNEEAATTGQENSSSSNPGMSLFGSAKHESSYAFGFTANTVLVTYKKKKNDSMYMSQSYGEQSILTQMEDNKSTIINDWNNESAIVLDEENKTGQVMSLKFLKKYANGNSENSTTDEDDMPTVTKTGKTKTIAGYLSEQYIIEDDDTKIDAWMTTEVAFSYQDYLSGFTKMLGKSTENMTNSFQDKGYMMEMTSYKKDKKEHFMQVQSIDETEKNIDLNTYTLTKL